MANPQSSDIGKGFSWKDPSANLGKWVPLGTEQEWEQRKRELDIKMNLEKEKLEMKRRLMQLNLDDYICSHGVCYPAPSSTKTPSPVSPLNIKEGFPPKLNVGDIHCVKSEEDLPPLSPGYCYESVSFNPNCYRLIRLSDIKPLGGATNLPEESVDNTHPTVLTWLIRYVDIQDIIQMFYLLDFYRRKDLLWIASASLKQSFVILELAYRFNEWHKKYEGVGEPPYIGELVEPIIR